MSPGSVATAEQDRSRYYRNKWCFVFIFSARRTCFQSVALRPSVKTLLRYFKFSSQVGLELTLRIQTFLNSRRREGERRQEKREKEADGHTESEGGTSAEGSRGRRLEGDQGGREGVDFAGESVRPLHILIKTWPTFRNSLQSACVRLRSAGLTGLLKEICVLGR